MNALASAIRAIADESAVAARPAALASRPAESATTPTAANLRPASAAESTAARPSATAWASARTTRSSWNATGLAFDARSRKTAGALHTQDRPAQSEIVLAGLQTVAQRSVHQERFVGIGRRGRCIILRGGRRDLVQFVFRGSRRGAEAALLLLRTLPELSGSLCCRGCKSSDHSVGCDPGPTWICLRAVWNPNIWTSTVYVPGARSGKFVGAGFVGGGHHTVIALGGDDGGARQRLAAELDDSRVRCADRRIRLRVQRRTKSQE